MSDTITFRSVTPLFHFTMGDGESFQHSGEVSGATFEATLKQYPQGADGFAELTKYTDARARESLSSIHMPPISFFGHADYFVVIDVTQAADEGMETHSNTKESMYVDRAILDSLRLNTSKGISRFNTYHWRSTPELAARTTSAPLMSPSVFSALEPGPSELLPSEFDNCRAVADALMAPWVKTIAFDQVMQMAMSYHDVIFSFHEPKHSFLLLMVIFETLFEGSDEETPKAVSRIADLLAKDRNDRRLITRRFRTGESSYTAIRNHIAHGDVSLDSAKVRDSYPGLYAYITRAIVQVLLMRGSTVFDPEQDYYKEISKLARAKYSQS